MSQKPVGPSTVPLESAVSAKVKPNKLNSSKKSEESRFRDFVEFFGLYKNQKNSRIRDKYSKVKVPEVKDKNKNKNKDSSSNSSSNSSSRSSSNRK